MADYKHMGYEERKIIEELKNAGKSTYAIAKTLNKCPETIRRELINGTINGRYNPEYAQSQHEIKQKNKGQNPVLLEEKELAQYISELILENNLSPESIIKLLNQDERYAGKVKALNTIYSAIKKGLIPGVTEESLKFKKKTSMFSDGLLRVPNWIKEEYGFCDGDQFEIEVGEDVIIFKKIMD